MITEVNPQDIVTNKRFKGICKRAYHGHSNGCPNYGKKDGCPPGLPLIDSVFDFDREFYVIYTGFPVGEFAERMRVNHPEWSEYPRQWYNPRRWQGSARKEHNAELERFLVEHPGFEYNTMPEAHGINVSEMMKLVSVEMDWEWPPKHNLGNMTYGVSVGGICL